ncbi:hypothetical protein MYX84_05205 [Acidobacteria bacterium AH-259-O06]|nr:hypothetical protein [Acidobacteria bacterium AH-259-O06]
MIHVPERVEAIRSRVAAEMKSVSDLEALVKDPYIRGQLQQVRNWLDDIEAFFLESLSREARTPEEESTWLSHAEMTLHLAARQRKSIQDLVAKYGPNITSIG